MKVAVLGTGMVGRAHAAKLASLGHEVALGTQDVARTLDPSRTAGDRTFADWHRQHPGVRLATFRDAVAGADLVLAALNGRVTVETLRGLADALADTVLIDIGNPLDFSSGQLELFVCNTDSLGEQIQRALPDTRVVKALSTVTADVQVDPQGVGSGDHDTFLAGDDPAAKAAVTELLHAYGWRTVVDLGPLTAARGLEMMLPMWLNLMNALGTARFGYRVIT